LSYRQLSIQNVLVNVVCFYKTQQALDSWLSPFLHEVEA